MERFVCYLGSDSIGPLKGFKKLRHLEFSATMLMGNPLLLPGKGLQISYSCEFLPHSTQVCQHFTYTSEQEIAFYQHLPEAMEALIILAIYGCIRRFLESDYVPPRLKRVELTYLFPALGLGNPFPGEEQVIVNYLEDLAIQKGIALIQSVDQNRDW
jgi:hypothetical protein